MRNAAATFNDDIGYDEPRRQAPRKSRAASSKPKARKTKKGKRFGFNMVKVARHGAIGISATVAIGIMVNALILQKGHHPAPLFGKAITLTELKPPPSPTPAPIKTTRDVVVAPNAQQAAALAAPPLPVAKPRHATIPAVAEKGASDDAIGKLLRGEPPAPAGGEKGETKTILAAQKALAKIGYAVKPNGTMGPATRKAIETFEKDRNLPVKGELSRRVVKILGAESGVKID